MPFNISSFLGRFKSFGAEEFAAKEALFLEIYDKTGVRLEGKDVEIKNGTAFIRTLPIIRGEVFMKKQEILRKMKEIGIKISDIR